MQMMPELKFVKLTVGLKLSEILRGATKSYQLGAFVKEVEFGANKYESPTSIQMAELTKKVAFNWLASVNVGKEDILNLLEFGAALPPTLFPNIAVCYDNKFHENNDPQKAHIQSRLDAAKALEGESFTIILDPNDLQFLIPVEKDNAVIRQELQVFGKNGQNISPNFVPLTSFNKDSQLISVKLSSANEQKFLGYAAKITGSEDTAAPTNAVGEKVPFSFTLAKMPNLIAKVDEVLAARQVNTPVSFSL